MSYDIGDTVPLGFDVKDDAGVATNATTATLTITLPDSTTTSPTLTNPSTGRYEYDYVPAQAGRYHVRVVTTEPAAAYTDVFDVTTQAYGIVSLTDGKGYLGITATDTSKDEEIRSLLGAVTSVIENIVGAVLVVSYTEKHNGGKRAVILDHTPVLSITSVTENGSTVDSSDYSLDDHGILSRVVGYADSRWTAGRNNITVVYVVGRREVPLSYIEAAKELLRINFRPQQGGNYTPFDRNGTEGTDQGVWRLGFFVPHGVMALLSDGRDPGGIA